MSRRLAIILFLGALFSLHGSGSLQADPPIQPGGGTFTATANGEGGNNKDGAPSMNCGGKTINQVKKNGNVVNPEDYTILNQGQSNAKVRFNTAPATTDSIVISGASGNSGDHTGGITWSEP